MALLLSLHAAGAVSDGCRQMSHGYGIIGGEPLMTYWLAVNGVVNTLLLMATRQ